MFGGQLCQRGDKCEEMVKCAGLAGLLRAKPPLLPGSLLLERGLAG
jgi:hypothetical protein